MEYHLSNLSDTGQRSQIQAKKSLHENEECVLK